MITHLFHQPYEPFAYALNSHLARIVVWAQTDSIRTIKVHFGDRYQASLGAVTEMTYAGWNGESDVYVADVAVPTSRLKYTFEAVLTQSAGSQSVWYGEGGIHAEQDKAGVFQLPYLCTRDVFTVPEWVRGAVCYQIFPERFENGSPSLTPEGALAWDAKPTGQGMHGGDLPGVMKRLDYLAELGVTLLYFTPIFLASSNHKYDTFDYKTIDPQFGTLEDFKQLVREAHARGIRVVLDAVFNHAGIGFAPFADVRKRGRKSRYHDWFFIDGDKPNLRTVNYETFATKLAYMPKLNVANPEVESYLLDVATYWIRECDIDGWRLDVANEIDHVFWRRFREAVKSAKSDALIVGEIWHDSLPWVRGDQFDSVMNYPFRSACLRFFIERSTSGKQFASDLVKLLYTVPEPAVRAMFNLVGSHDTERFLTLAEGNVDTALLALTCQFTYPGITMVYYGDEVGMEGGPDPDCRRGMIWDEKLQNQVLRKAVTSLSHLRKEEPALWGGRFVVESADARCVVYRRIADDGQSAVTIAINAGPSDTKIKLSGPLLYETVPGAFKNDTLRANSAVILRASAQRSLPKPTGGRKVK